MQGLAKTGEEILDRARTLSKDEIWAAVPEFFRTSEAIKADLADAGPKLAAALYKDLFWEVDPENRGMRLCVPVMDLLPLMLGLYLQKGGTTPEAELNFWLHIFKLHIAEV